MTPISKDKGGFVQLGTVLQGAQPLREKGINDSFRGQLLLADGTIKSAIIKDLDPKQLANELMAAALAHATGLPIPNAHLAKAPQGVIPAKRGPTHQDGSRLVFGSADAQTPPVAQLYVGKDEAAMTRVRQRLSEWKSVGDLYGFDSWVANIDRHERNLLFSGDRDVWLIDHGHCFTGPAWTPANLDPTKQYTNKLTAWLTPVMSAARRDEVASQAAKLPTIAGGLDLKGLGEVNYIASMLDEADFDALVAFLKERIRQVPKLAAAAVNIDIMV
jgi:hypothetical protein